MLSMFGLLTTGRGKERLVRGSSGFDEGGLVTVLERWLRGKPQVDGEPSPMGA